MGYQYKYRVLSAWVALFLVIKFIILLFFLIEEFSETDSMTITTCIYCLACIPLYIRMLMFVVNNYDEDSRYGDSSNYEYDASCRLYQILSAIAYITVIGYGLLSLMTIQKYDWSAGIVYPHTVVQVCPILGFYIIFLSVSVVILWYIVYGLCIVFGGCIRCDKLYEVCCCAPSNIISNDSNDDIDIDSITDNSIEDIERIIRNCIRCDKLYEVCCCAPSNIISNDSNDDIDIDSITDNSIEDIERKDINTISLGNIETGHTQNNLQEPSERTIQDRNVYSSIYPKISDTNTLSTRLLTADYQESIQ